MDEEYKHNQKRYNKGLSDYYQRLSDHYNEHSDRKTRPPDKNEDGLYIGILEMTIESQDRIIEALKERIKELEERLE